MRFLPGIADFSYNLNKWRYRSMSDARILDELEVVGAKAFQLDFLFNHDHGEANRLEIHARSKTTGMVLTGAEYGAPSRELFERQVKAAHELGMTVVRHAFQPYIGLQERIPVEELRSALKTAAEVYAGTGLRYALENHQDYTADELVDAFESVGSNDIGIFLDTGNSIALLEDPVYTAQKLAPFTFGVHLKEYAVMPAPGGYDLVGVTMGTGVVDNSSVLRAIDAAAPSGTIPVLLENPLERCRMNLFAEPFRRILGEQRIADLTPVAALIEQSQEKFPDGITLPFEDTELTPETVQEIERKHNRDAFSKQLEILQPFA